MSYCVPRADRPRIAVLTMVNGQHGHLLQQVDGLSLSTWPPDVHVVTSVSDHEVSRGRLPIYSDRWTTLVPKMPWARPVSAFPPGLDLACRHAVNAGADVLIYLSVHCIPSRHLIQALAEQAAAPPDNATTLWHSEVLQLGPAPDIGYPLAGDLHTLVAPTMAAETHSKISGPDPRWSDSFAVSTRDWAHARWLWSRDSTCTKTNGSPSETTRPVEQRLLPGVTAYRQHPSGASLTFKGSRRAATLGETA
jgi:hypothetical protein